MKFIGAPGSEDRKKFLAYCAFAVLAIGVLYYELGDSTPTNTPATPVVTSAPTTRTGPANAAGPGAKIVGTSGASYDPTLHPQVMRAAESITYEGSGRNIFSATAAAPAVFIPKPIATPRPVAVQTVVAVPAGPPPPPPIDIKFAGYFSGPDGADRQVILVHGDDVVLARSGDIVLRRYKILSVSANSIQVEDMPYNHRQVIPLTN
jgi:hypothetical protein